MKAVFASIFVISVAACSSNDTSGPPAGDGGASGSSSSSGTASSSSGTASSSSGGGSSGVSTSSSSSGNTGGGVSCTAGDGDSCLCFSASSPYPPNATTPCSKSQIKDPGVCCAETGWPQKGMCRCAAFLCYVNQGGGKDCQYNDLNQNGLEQPSTSASGAACCIKGAPDIGYYCSCYSDISKGSCDGFPTVPSCTMNALPPCKDIVTNGYTPVDSCR